VNLEFVVDTTPRHVVKGGKRGAGMGRGNYILKQAVFVMSPPLLGSRLQLFKSGDLLTLNVLDSTVRVSFCDGLITTSLIHDFPVYAKPAARTVAARTVS
jgi:hypothetical protein